MSEQALKNMVEFLERRVKALQEEVEGHRQLQALTDATTATLLRAHGADKEHPVRVEFATIRESMEHYRVCVERVEGGFVLHYGAK